MKKRKFVASVMVFSMLLGQTAYAQEMVMPVESAEALESEQEIETLETSEVSVKETDVIKETEEIKAIEENEEKENIEDTESAEVLTSEDSANYSVLKEGKNSLEITEGGQKAIGSFVPEESREYVFDFISENNILGSYEVTAELYDSEMNLLAGENNINTSDDFKFTYTLEAGQTYYISVKYSFDWDTGTVDFGIFKVADDVTWSVDEEGTLTIQGDGALVDYNGQEPWADETIKKLVIGEGITDLSDNTFSNSDITSVSLPSGLMKISKSCFNSCYYLEEINVPESIEKIGSYAFSGCSALRKIVIPDSVTKFGESVFSSMSEVFCIVGVKGSAAETYANEKGISFVDIDNPVFSLDRCQITLKRTIVYYDGTEKKPEVILMDGGQKLAEGEDYTVAYEDNVEIGTGRAIITGIGHYEGTAECTFDIKERKLYEKNMIIGNSWYETKNYDYDADWNREYRWIAADLNNITVESDAPSICEVADYEIQEDNYNTIPEQRITLKLHALKTGAATIYVKDSDGTVLFETQVHVVETPENAVIFEDPVLQMEMTDSYDRDKNGYLTEDEIPSYDYLSLKCVYHGEYVQSLDGLDKMEKVTSLDLQDCNEVRNFSAVNQMPKLESLHISNAEMESMEWLQSREVLQHLELSGCTINSWKGLEKMTDLVSLKLNHVGFSSAEVLNGMQKLETLDLSYNEDFTDIQSLSVLKSLNCLELDNTGVTDEEKWNFEAIPDEVTLKQGDTYKVLKYLWLIDIETSIVDGDGVIGDGYYRNEFDALEPGTAKIHVSYTDQLNKDVIIHVQKSSESIPEEISWNLDNGVLTISGEGAMDNYTKAANQPWYQDREKITSVVVEDGITEIGNFAFYGLTNLNDVYIADSVTKIDGYAFKNCTALTDIQLPKNLETIGESAFYSCTGFSSVTFPESVTCIDGYAFARCTGMKQIAFDGDAPEIQAGAFSGVKADVDYPKENTTWTEDKKQNYGGQLTWEKAEPWEIKDHVLTINDDSVMVDYDSAKKTPWYAERDEITNIVISDGVTKVGAFAFYGLNNLTSVALSDTVASIGGYAFKNSVKLSDINLPTGMKKIGESAFYGCSSLKSITIPEGLYTIWAYTFKNCTSLSEVNLPSTLIKIDEAAFYGCTSLEKIDIPDNVSIIGVYCFKNCTKLSEVKLSKKLTQIREAVFYGCTSLPEITIPEKVESIGNYAFRRCEGLKTMELPETLKTIGESSFYGCSNLSEFALPEGLTTLGDYAFKNCIKVKEVNLPASLTTIGASTFYGCTGLIRITIPKKVTAIGAYAFSSCSGLKEVWFAGAAPEIGAYAFSRVTADVYYPADNNTWTADKLQNYGGKLNWIKN